MTCDTNCTNLDLNVMDSCGNPDPINPFPYVLRWASGLNAYRPVSAATNAAPCVLTVIAHGLPSGWPFLLVQMAGMPEIERSDPANPYLAIVLSANSLELNEVNATELPAYDGGGLVQYQTPMDLSAVSSATLHIKSSASSPTAIVTSTLGNGIAVDNTAKTITLEPTNAQIGSLPAATYYYELKVFTTDVVNPALWIGGALIWPVVI